MKIVINNIRLPLEHSLEDVKAAAAKKLKIKPENFNHFRITKESIDARRKPNISFVSSVLVELNGVSRLPEDNDIRVLDELPDESLEEGNLRLEKRPVVVGMGPAGLFAGLLLAQRGYRPVMIERGEPVDRRMEIVHGYWRGNPLDTETNVQFGEGGAGTFSDGKLTTRINDRRCEKVLEELHASGAPGDILFKAKPHIGTDILKNVVVNLRKRIIEYGGEIRFNTRMTSLDLKDGRLAGIVTNGKETIPAEVVVLAIGHSARDTFEMLLDQGVEFIQKPFSIGVRIEHPQEVIDQAQFGAWAGHPRLGTADYQLFYKTGKRTAYTFCMCPGGTVVASASERGMIVTNGMSEFSRSGKNANSAWVVSVEPSDFGTGNPLAGVEFQRQWERLAYTLGGSRGAAPVQLLEDFLNSRPSSGLGTVKPSYTGQIQPADLHGCLPDYVTGLMCESAGYFDKKLKGFAMRDAVLTGVETRTSSPVRIPRKENMESVSLPGLYPAGEGAGYAGGIISAAVDGLRVAEEIVRKYIPMG